MEAIGPNIVDSITSQVDLLTTLAVAICGGIVALLVQVGFHNSDDSKKKATIRWGCLLLVAFGAEGVSLIFGYLTHAAVTDAIPILLQLEYDSSKTLAELDFEQEGHIRTAMIVQALAFGIGIACVFAVVWKNISNLLGGWR